jgi:hypothetical protein
LEFFSHAFQTLVGDWLKNPKKIVEKTQKVLMTRVGESYPKISDGYFKSLLKILENFCPKKLHLLELIIGCSLSNTPRKPLIGACC